MSNLNLLLAENEDFKIVEVVFNNSPKVYHYKTTLDVKEDDTVVVDTPSNGLSIVTVKSVTPAIEHDLSFNFKIKWIVSKVDLDYYEQCKELESKLNRKLNQLRAHKRREEIKDQLADQVGAEGVEELAKLVRL